MEPSEPDRTQRYAELNIADLMQKLDELYEREERLKCEYIQVCEDIELMQAIIMHRSNSLARSI